MVGSSDSQRVAATQQRLFWEKEKCVSEDAAGGSGASALRASTRPLFSPGAFFSLFFIHFSLNCFRRFKIIKFLVHFLLLSFFFIFLFIFGAIKVALFFCGFPILSMLLFVITLRF